MQIKLTIDRFENKIAVLKTEKNKTINWPKNKLPKSLKEGSVVNFFISSNPKKSEKNKELAKEILNEILNV